MAFEDFSGGSVAKRKSRNRESRNNEAQLDELGSDPGQVGSDSAGQSGDTQGLSQVADAADESVEELADTDQAYEAEIVDGIEDAADHPERPVYTREDQARSEEIPPKRGE
jgi:hypothetical protein